MSHKERDYKVNMTFTIPISLIMWAKQHAVETDTPLSHIIAQALAEMKASKEAVRA